MTEFALTLSNPALAAHVLGVAAIKYEADKDAEAVAICNSMAAQIEAQVKPAIEEPLAFGSVVRSANATLYVRVGAAQARPWATGEALRSWDQFDAVEVLRVGVGETPGDAWSRGYEEGVDSNRPSPVDRSAIHSALVEAADDATTAVMQALS